MHRVKALPPEEGIETQFQFVDQAHEMTTVKALPPEEGIETWGWVGTGKLGSGVKALPPEEGIETLEPTTN